MNGRISRSASALFCSLVLAAAAAQGFAAPKTRTITDAAGRVVEIPAAVTKVADAWPANVGMVLMLGGADKLVGITQQAQNQPWLRKLYPKIMSVPIVVNASNDINIESLIGANPDVVIMSYVGGMPAWMDKVAAAKIPVVLMPGNSFEDIKTSIRMIGEVLGPASAAWSTTGSAIRAASTSRSRSRATRGARPSSRS